MRREPGGGLSIEGVDSDTFQRLSDFLYQGVVPAVTPAWVMERKLYYLADVLGATELMNRLTDALQDYHLQTNSHFMIHQVAQILPVLNGTGIWGYCMAGLAYQVSCNLYRVGDPSFEVLCREYPQLWEIILLDIKEHGTEYQSWRDYRRRAAGEVRGSEPCEYHVHPPDTACHLDSSPEASLDSCLRDTTLFLGRYPVSKVKLEFNEIDALKENTPRSLRRAPRRPLRMGNALVTRRPRQIARRGKAFPVIERQMAIRRRPRTRI
jgi:hypothetical protein